MYTFVNFFSQSFYQTNSTLTPPPSPTTASTLQHECNICKTSFKSQSGLTRHNTIVQKYNTRREGLYTLPLEAINEFKAQLVHVIQGKLKDHFSQSGKQTIYLPCLESLFFGVFEGYIHYYNYRTGSYKCFFQGPDAYTQIANLFDNPNWGRKFFDNNQQTFVVLFDALAESDANQESLFNQVGNWIPKNRLKRFNLPKLTVEWKYKKSREDAKKNRTSAGYISLRFCAQQI
uniref:C2H2-type domain-containing protein n=1 Tax=Rhizophagus irregularis (strain DAOM 181602 / DAOM 197198 / MUCL 43194) TaxID=747089 RepID=U9T5Z5_RHIID